MVEGVSWLLDALVVLGGYTEGVVRVGRPGQPPRRRGAEGDHWRSLVRALRALRRRPEGPGLAAKADEARELYRRASRQARKDRTSVNYPEGIIITLSLCSLGNKVLKAPQKTPTIWHPFNRVKFNGILGI